MVAWILGGLLLGGGAAVASQTFGWILLGGGAAIFLPRLWRLEHAEMPTRVRYLLRAPYFAFSGLFMVFAIMCVGAMGQAMSAGATVESILLALGSLVMFDAVAEFVMPMMQHVRRLELDGRPQPLAFNVLEVARDSGGRLTPAELAADYGVAYLQAQRALMNLTREGACERIVTRNGAIVFRFPELETDKIDLLE